MSTTTVKNFGAADISVFTITLVLAALVGVYYAYKDRKKKTLKNYYYGGKKMSPVPLGMSMSVTFISAITVMSYPGDTYIFGAGVLWFSFSTVWPTLIASLYYIPFLHTLQFMTIHQFLESRFHRNLRFLCSGMEIFNNTIYMGITIYLPALAINAVTPLKLSWSIALTGGICTFYTVVGGIKAVVWTDVLQSVIMLTGVVAALIKGSIIVGGFGNIWEAMERGNRTNILDLDPNPTLRNTFWTIIIGYGLTQCSIVCVNQSIYQRYLSCSSANKAKKAAWLAVVLKVAIATSTVLCGCVAYTYFERCDPIQNGEIAKSDQIMPYFVMNLFYDLPGLAGFYVAAVYSGTLSTVSSGINSMTALILRDFFHTFKAKMTGEEELKFSKIFGLVLGCLVTALAYLASVMGGTVIKLAIIFRTACGVPVLAVYTMGMFLPWINSKGAFAGQIMGTISVFWLALGSYVYGKPPELDRRLETSVEGCVFAEESFRNVTTVHPDLYNFTSTATMEPEKIYPSLYLLSYLYISWVGFLISIAVGFISSFLTGANKPSDLNPKYFVPFLDNPRFPKKIRSFFRFGVAELDPSIKESQMNGIEENKNELLSKRSEDLENC